MVLALDVHYRENEANCVGVLFDWNEDFPSIILEHKLSEFDEYVSGEFYKRELPCLISLIDKVDLNKLECIIIDGYVYTDDDFTLGLGGRLWEELKPKIPIIGVAKTSFFSK